MPEDRPARQTRWPLYLRAVLTLVVVAGIGWPAIAGAQWRGPRSHPYPPYGLRAELTGSVRVEATPREAEVYVDGYLAGVVDTFDGFFQRLRLEAGGHQLTIYREGFRTVTRDVYVAPGGDLHLKLTLEVLAAGEVSEPPPAPEDVVVPEPPLPPAGRPAGGGEAAARAASAPREAFGALAVRVTPADATIRIDGEAPEIIQGAEGPVIRLPVGEHEVVISREGYQTYTEKVLILRGRTLTLRVRLNQQASES